MTINGLDIDIEYKNIKNLHLSVYPPDGRVHISAPIRLSEQYIHNFVISKLSWINRKREQLIKRNIHSPKDYIFGECHYFLGQPYRLNVIPIYGREALQHIEICGDSLLLYARISATKENREAILYSWYKAQLSQILRVLIPKWEQKLGVELAHWEIRYMKSSWGSCSKQRSKALFNLQLAKKPIICVEYVVAHELAHLIEPNHSDRFKRILDICFPKWKAVKKELNEFPA